VPRRVEIGDLHTEFEEGDDGHFVARLDEVELVEGIVQPYDPKPKRREKKRAQQIMETTQTEVVMVGEVADEPGRALLSVEARTEEQDAPIKWTRPVTVGED
jgi:hypothetical protein